MDPRNVMVFCSTFISISCDKRQIISYSLKYDRGSGSLKSHLESKHVSLKWNLILLELVSKFSDNESARKMYTWFLSSSVNFSQFSVIKFECRVWWKSPIEVGGRVSWPGGHCLWAAADLNPFRLNWKPFDYGSPARWLAATESPCFSVIGRRASVTITSSSRLSGDPFARADTTRAGRQWCHPRLLAIFGASNFSLHGISIYLSSTSYSRSVSNPHCRLI